MGVGPLGVGPVGVGRRGVLALAMVTLLVSGGPAIADDLPGTPVTGGSEPASAAPLTTGLYLVDAPGAGQTRWFRVDKDPTGGRIWYGATVDLPWGSDSGFEVGATRADDEGRDCGPWASLVSTVLQVVPMTYARTTDAGPCESADSVLVGVRQRGDVPPGTQVQLSVWVEPRIDNRADLPPPPDPAWSTPAAAPDAVATDETAGTTFTDAPVLESYRSYHLAIDPDVPAYVRIPLRFGQHAQVRARPGWAVEGGYVDTRWVSPLGGDTGNPISVPDQSSTLVTDRRVWSAAWLSPTITPLAEQTDYDVPAAVPGDWFLVFTGHSVPGEYTVTLDVRVITDSADPQPAYAAAPAPVPSLAGDTDPVAATARDGSPDSVDAVASRRSWAAPALLGAGAVACAGTGAILLAWARRLTRPGR